MSPQWHTPYYFQDKNVGINVFEIESHSRTESKLNSIIASGSVVMLKAVIDKNKIITDRFSLKTCFSMLQYAVLSGEVAMLQFVDNWLDKNFHKDYWSLRQMNSDGKVVFQEPDECEITDFSWDDRVYFGFEDQKLSSKKLSRKELVNFFLNRSHLLQAALLSSRIGMLDYVLKNYVDKKVSELTPIFALTCIHAAICSRRIDFMRAVVANNELVRLAKTFVPSSGIKSFSERRMHEHYDHYQLNETLKKMIATWPLQDIQWVNDNIYQKFWFKRFVDYEMPDLYLSFVFRDDVEREYLLKMFEISWRKIRRPQRLYVLMNVPRYVLNLAKDFLLDIQVWRGSLEGFFYSWDHHRSMTMQLSVADIAACRGNLNTLEKALQEWHVPVDASLLSVDADKNPGLLQLAAVSGKADVFNLALNFIEKKFPKIDWLTVRWDLILDNACFSARLKNNIDIVIAVLKAIHDKNPLIDIKSMLSNCIFNGLGCGLPVIPYAIENHGFSFVYAKGEKCEQDLMVHALKNDGLYYALCANTYKTVRYLIDELNYNVRGNSDLINKVLYEAYQELASYQVSTCFLRNNRNQRGPSDENILGMLIDKGLIISEKQLLEIKNKYFSFLHDELHVQMSRKEFESLYGPCFEKWIKKINPVSQVSTSAIALFGSSAVTVVSTAVIPPKINHSH